MHQSGWNENYLWLWIVSERKQENLTVDLGWNHFDLQHIHEFPFPVVNIGSSLKWDVKPRQVHVIDNWPVCWQIPYPCIKKNIIENKLVVFWMFFAVKSPCHSYDIVISLFFYSLGIAVKKCYCRKLFWMFDHGQLNLQLPWSSAVTVSDELAMI